LICEDENHRTFIVEMQLGYYKHFIQRSKFYAFHRFNTLVEKGNYKFDHLTPIYCIGFLAQGIFPKSSEYYHFARLMNQKGEELDQQITHIIVEKLFKNGSILQMREEERQQIANETAKNLKELGVKIDVIAKSTGLTIEEIENL